MAQWRAVKPRMIERRTFVHTLALGLTLGPRSTAAQPAGKVYRIGVLSVAARPQSPGMDAFRQGLRDRGYVEGRDFIIEFRAAGDAPEASSSAQPFS